jgi:hypothetical protein
MSLVWDQSLSLALSDVHFTLYYDRHVRMTRLSLLINDLNARLHDDLLIYPCQATLKLDHLRTYSLLQLEFSSMTIQIDFDRLAYLIDVINQIRIIIDIVSLIFQSRKPLDTVDDDTIYVDDLRNGTMKCLFETSTDQPNVNEIHFQTINQKNLASSMTWKYAQRRSILKCHILPLPFDDDSLAGVIVANRIKTVV